MAIGLFVDASSRQLKVCRFQDMSLITAYELIYSLYQGKYNEELHREKVELEVSLKMILQPTTVNQVVAILLGFTKDEDTIAGLLKVMELEVNSRKTNEAVLAIGKNNLAFPFMMNGLIQGCLRVSPRNAQFIGSDNFSCWTTTVDHLPEHLMVYPDPVFALSRDNLLSVKEVSLVTQNYSTQGYTQVLSKIRSKNPEGLSYSFFINHSPGSANVLKAYIDTINVLTAHNMLKLEIGFDSATVAVNKKAYKELTGKKFITLMQGINDGFTQTANSYLSHIEMDGESVRLNVSEDFRKFRIKTDGDYLLIIISKETIHIYRNLGMIVSLLDLEDEVNLILG